MEKAMLAPAAALVVWTLVMLVWMARSRFPAMAEAGLDIGTLPPGGRGQDLEGVLPDRVNWKAHNYTHLLEQPTLFYAVVVMLAMMEPTLDLVVAAWLYTALRIIHSVWQATVNAIGIRLHLFRASTLVLGYLAVRTLLLTFT